MSGRGRDVAFSVFIGSVAFIAVFIFAMAMAHRGSTRTTWSVYCDKGTYADVQTVKGDNLYHCEPLP